MKSIKRHLPVITTSILYLFSLFFFIRALVKLGLMFFVSYDEPMPIIPLIGEADERSFIELFISVPVFIYTWLWSTRVAAFQGKFTRFFTFHMMLGGIVIQVAWNATAPVYQNIVPFLNDQAKLFDLSNKALEEVFLAELPILSLTITALPSVFVGMSCIYVGKIIVKHKKKTFEFIADYKWRTSRLQTFFRSQVDQNVPNVQLGRDSVTKEMVYQDHKDRTLNNLIIGSIGTGKTAALITPMLNGDLNHLTYFINHFRQFQEEGMYEEKKGHMLNSISVIEPSNDLCQNVERLAKAHGIPDEAVYYVNPIDAETKSVNPLKGPVGKVAEVLTSVVEGIGETQEYFFQQSQRTHLKNYVYLLKLHDPTFKPKLDDLIDMYNDDMLVKSMHEKLKDRIKEEKNAKDIEDRDERNRVEILKGLDDWLNRTLTAVEERNGPNVTHARESRRDNQWHGELLYEDSKSEHVIGLRNILDDMSKNELIRRVLFGESDFDFDDHMKHGGLLIVNTSKGSLVQLSDVLGRFFALSLQNAVFRRTPNVEPYHSLYIDEFSDYIYESFREFPAQSRKYKNITTVATQTISQLEHKYNRPFMETLLGTMRNKFIYANIPQIDADYFSHTFGTAESYEEGEMDQVVGPLQEDPKRRIGISASKVEKPIMEPSDLIYQKKGQCAYQIVVDNETQKVRQLDANFLPKEYFEEAEVLVTLSEGEYWIDYRRQHGLDDIENNNLDGVKVEDMKEEHPPVSAQQTVDSDRDNVDSVDFLKDDEGGQPNFLNAKELLEEKKGERSPSTVDVEAGQDTAANKVIEPHGDRDEEEKHDIRGTEYVPPSSDNSTHKENSKETGKDLSSDINVPLSPPSPHSDISEDDALASFILVTKEEDDKVKKNGHVSSNDTKVKEPKKSPLKKESENLLSELYMFVDPSPSKDREND